MQKCLKNNIFIGIYAFFYSFAYTQNPHPSFRQYTAENGLASSEVYQVKQDSKGYLWFATGNGVSRFNGYEFQNFSMNDGLPDNTVFEIYEDKKGRIWFVPISCKLSYYYNGAIHPFPYDEALQKRLKNPIKSSFEIDEEGNIFLGVKSDGIYKISEKGGITHIVDTTVSTQVTELDSGKIIYATNVGNNKYAVKFTTSQLKGITRLPDNSGDFNMGNALVKTKNKLLIFSMRNKLYVMKSLNDFKILPFPKRIIWLSEDREGDWWIGTDLGGVYRVQNGDFKNMRHYLPGISINSVFQDREDGFWFASEYEGVFYTPSKHILTYDVYSGLKDSKINCLATDGQAVYAGLPAGYVQKITSRGLTTYNCNSKEENRNYISNIYYDTSKKRLLVAGKLQYGTIENGNFQKGNVFGFFSDVAPISKNNYWVTHSNGLYKIDDEAFVLPPERQFLFLKIRSEAILQTPDSVVWAGAINGLWKKEPHKTAFSYIGDTNPLLQSRVLDLAHLPDARLAIATKGAGMVVYSSDTVYQIDESKGLYSNKVNKLWADGWNIWAATDNGLNRIHFTGEKSYRIDGYTTAEGMASNEVISVVKTGNTVWAATNKGLSVFQPDAYKKDSTKIPLYIDEVLVNEKKKPRQTAYQLKYYQNTIKIRFTALGYRNAGKLAYRYKMESLDSAWAYTHNREIQYTTLPPGAYSFHVSVLQPDGLGNEAATTLHFTIHKPFWSEWWFRLLLVSAFLAIVFFALRYRINQIKKREARQSELNKTLLQLKLKALRAQINPHFIFNVMNSIQHFILHKDVNQAYHYLSRFSRLIRIILNNSEHTLIPLAEELKALELYLELEAMRFEKQFDYTIRIDPAIDPRAVDIPPMILQPYIENAIKHGILPLQEKGTLTIDIRRQGAMLQCSVEDNGIGRARAAERSAKEHTSMGTSITQSRLLVLNQLHNSQLSERTIDLKDANGDPLGTRVELFIPINI